MFRVRETLSGHRGNRTFDGQKMVLAGNLGDHLDT
jgi:hypothetical protein